MKKNQDYKNAALGTLRGNWAPAVVCAIVYVLIAVVISMFQPSVATDDSVTGTQGAMSLVYMLLYIFVMLPIILGMYQTFNVLYTEGDNKLTSNMFKLAFGTYGRNLAGMLLMFVFTLLWTLLFIIPGVIKAIAYSMTPYILKDYPELSPNQAINLSQKMMKGHKFDFFYLVLSFLGWALLCILTLGIGTLWLSPYVYTSFAAFYEDVKKEYLANSTL